MRRGRREKINTVSNGKYLIYTSLGILAIMIITFIVTFIVYKNKLKNNSYSELTTEKIADLVPNDINESLEQVNSDIGKSIEDAVKEAEEKIKEEENKNELEENNENNNASEDITTETVETNTEPVKPKDPEFSMPVEGEIVRDYAKDSLIYSDTLQEWITHLGIDIKAPRTTVVKSAEAGKVVAIKNDPRYGLTIVIEHTNGFKSVYSNLLTTEFVIIE